MRLRHIAAALIACAVGALPGTALAAPKKKPRNALHAALVRAAPAADPRVIGLAVEALECATAADAAELGAQRLAVIDYSLPSTEPRLWVFDLSRRTLVFEERVAHGRNSGDNYARHFSNEPNSYATSLGLFRTAGTYEGRNGYSLRMSGLEPGINDRAEERAIVVHGAPYATGDFVKTTGRLGRSHGCPAVRPEIAASLIDEIKGGQYLYAYYPDPDFLAASQYVGGCKAGKAREPGVLRTVVASAAAEVGAVAVKAATFGKRVARGQRHGAPARARSRTLVASGR